MKTELQAMIDNARIEAVKIEQEWLTIKAEILPKIFALRNRLNEMADEIDRKAKEEKAASRFHAPLRTEEPLAALPGAKHADENL